jgi:4-amino-4-deoxy-L-arabinose transferase-like glycosyltransferase
MVLAGSAVAAVYGAMIHTPPLYELGHLPAGICHWEYGRYELYRVNPPLARMVATLPLVLLGESGPERDWSNYQLDPLSRETVPMGIRFYKANGERAMLWFRLARLAGLVFLPLGAWACYAWGRALWDARAGLAAAVLWSVQPMVWGWGGFVMPDVPAAAVGAYASFRFWRWLRAWVGRARRADGGASSPKRGEAVDHSSTPRPAAAERATVGKAGEGHLVDHGGGHLWGRSLAAGTWLGLAQLTKLTLLVLVPVWLLLTVVGALGVGRGRNAMIVQGAAMLLAALLIINVGYGFRDSFLPLAEYRFASSLFSGKSPEPVVRAADDPLAEQEPRVRLVAGNRWTHTWLARLPVPLPRDYVMGIDCQRGDFEVGGRSYFGGRWSERGWWWYQPVGLALKTPVGTLVLVGLALAIGLAGLVGLFLGASRLSAVEGSGAQQPRRWVDGLLDGLCLVLPVALIFTLLCTQTGFSSHVRYALPATPYLAVLAGRLAWGAMARAWQLTCWALIGLAAVEAAAVYPHGISFFNVLAGGPSRGHEWLLDSNIACGQDLLYLRDWQRAHPEARPLHLATASGVNPAQVGIEFVVPPIGPSERIRDREHLARLLRDARTVMGEAPADAAGLGPQPGWYVIDVNHLHGTAWGVSRPEGTRQRLCTRGLNYEYFRRLRPCGRIAYSYLVYHVTAEEAVRLRRALGLE